MRSIPSPEKYLSTVYRRAKRARMHSLEDKLKHTRRKLRTTIPYANPYWEYWFERYEHLSAALRVNNTRNQSNTR